jgi:hypothetical protein
LAFTNGYIGLLIFKPRIADIDYFHIENRCCQENKMSLRKEKVGEIPAQAGGAAEPERVVSPHSFR